MKQTLRSVVGLAALMFWMGCGDERAGEPKGQSAGVSSVAQALASVPSGFTASTWAGGLSSPTAMSFSPDGRLFVTEQGGRLRVIKNGALLSTPFVTLNVDSSVERGLLGVAADPNFASNGWVYVYYTATSPSVHNRVSRFTANGDVAVAGSEQVLLDLNTLGASHHNGGALHFGPDGKLFIATGDNGVSTNAQSLGTLLGKILRMNRDGTVPTDNPFYSSATGNNRLIWALGLRNPFTFAFENGTSRMFINDVGESTYEEVNAGAAGANYGWPATEGPTTNPSYRGPVHWYTRSEGCAITGGAFYNQPTHPFPSSYTGDYFYADFCSGWIRAFDATTNSMTTFATGLNGPVDLKIGADGALYYLERGNGLVGRIEYSVSTAPTITQHPASITVAAGQTATFFCSATGSAPLTYQWQRNAVNVAGATSSSYSLTATTSDNGARFRCVVTNSRGTATSNEATLTVLSSSPPRATITAPATGTLYSAGDVIPYAGTGTDPEDGTLPASAFRWRVDFHHDTHVHPFVPETSGAQSGSFTVPTRGETSANVWYRIHLTVTDSTGLSHSTFVDVRPRTVQITLDSNPSGLQLTLDGQPVTAPHTFTGVVGLERALGVVSPQTVNGVNYEFASWSDQGTATHTVRTPSAATTYVATFRTATAGTGLNGEYFNNMDLTAPAVQRVDARIDFNWGNGSPEPTIGADTFSVRWTGQVKPAFTETYTFYTTSDDGVRLWVNGLQVINNWTNHAPVEDSGRITLAANQTYDIRLEYYENGGGAVASLSWSSPSTPKQVIPTSALFPAPSTSQTVSLTLASDPTGLQLTVDGQTVTAPYTFSSVVGTTHTLGVVSPQSKNGVSYTFTGWSDQGAATHTITTPPASTTYTATFGTGPQGGSGTGLAASYFHDMGLTSLAVSRLDPTINFAWGTGSPDPSIAADTFSARWTGQVMPAYSETYTFYTTSDDGIRLWVNGALVINNWTDHAPIENSGQVRLVANQRYDIRLEFYENSGGATARLSWSSPSTPKQIIPTSALYPDAVASSVPLTVASSPSGLQLTVDGQVVTAPHTFTSTVGTQRTLGVLSPQTLNGVTYEFVSWSDQGAATHTITTPATATTWTATFRATTSETGTGLTADYFNNMDLTGFALRRVDPRVDFNWGNGTPDPAVAPDTFSVRWTGKIRPTVSETYTFYTTSDDGIRLWVNGVLVINNWTDHAPVENSGTVTLVANQKYDLRLEFYDKAEGAVARLSWSSPSTPKQVVPTSALFP